MLPIEKSTDSAAARSCVAIVWHRGKTQRASRGRDVVNRRPCPSKMFNSPRALAHYVRNKIVWNRIGVLLSPVVIGVALVVLFHMPRDIKVHEVVRALRAIQPEQTIAAAVSVAGGYFTLTFYDWFALRTIGPKEIRIASPRSLVLPAIRSGVREAMPVHARLQYRKNIPVDAAAGHGVIITSKFFQNSWCRQQRQSDCPRLVTSLASSAPFK